MLCISSSSNLCEGSQPILANVEGVVVLQVALIVVVYELKSSNKTK